MPERVARGTWVEIRSVVLDAGQRAPGVPDDTQHVALELRVKGTLQTDAALGEEVAIVTPSGRRLIGTLVAANPAYTHGFGPPIDAIMEIGCSARELLAKASGDRGGPR